MGMAQEDASDAEGTPLTDGELDSFFDRLLGRLPSPPERELLLRTQKELGIPDGDGVWMVLVVLGHYQQLYERIPEKIETASSFAIEQAKRRLHAETEAETKRIHGALTKAVLDTIDATAGDLAKAERRRATALMGTVCLALVVVGGVGSYLWGFAEGSASSSSAELWGQSERGQYARTLDEFGVVGLLRACQESTGDFRITKDRVVICEAGTRVQSMGPLPKHVIRPD